MWYGILADVRENHPQWRFGWQTTRFVDLLARLGNQAYVFSPEDVDLNTGTTLGYMWQAVESETGYWAAGQFPLPKVIYDRYMPPPGRVRAKTDALCEHLADSGECIFVNHPRMARMTRNKWETAQFLRDHPTLASFLPRIHRLKWDPITQQFLDKENVVFVKPTEGSQGRGVMRYESQALDYILQEALDPLTLDGRVLDLRILMQRDGHGKWVIPPWIGRVGAISEHRANLAVGGEAWPGHLALELALSDRIELLAEVEQKIWMFLNTLPSVLETVGPCGEMGIDFLVDQHGKVWCLEINPKPGFEGLRAIGRMIGRDLRGEALNRMADQMRWLMQKKEGPSGNGC